jgi:RNA-directed DNA polymerase
MNVLHSKTPLCEKHTNRKLASEWDTIDWKGVRESVNRLQTRIAKAVQEQKWNLVKRLQYLLTHSYYAKLLAVRIVTTNKGKNTPGIDGEIWLSASSKMKAAISLSDRHYKAKPLRRIYIPKPGKNTKRPISIPIMYDRAMQVLYGLALQPIAETTADNRSFGFRLFRSPQDASQQIFACLAHPKSAQWILECDIQGCFDNISHEWLKKHITMDLSVLKQFLKAGFVFEGKTYPTDTGTPQGGSLSPILANMALDGLESLITSKFPDMKVHFIRYADDMIVTAPTKEIATEIKDLIQVFLSERHLQLSESKTLITHIDDGFTFLGWNFRKYNGVLITKPSKESIKRILEKIGNVIRKAKAWSQEQLIKALNPIIVGWTNYNKHVVSKDTFSRMDLVIWGMLWHWAKRRHGNKGHIWIAHKYWHTENSRNWVFKTKDEKLMTFSSVKIKRHPWLRLNANPYLDRNYFIERMKSLEKKETGVQTKLSFFPHNRPQWGL